MTKAEWSGWGQAVAAVGAIGFGYWGLRRQAGRQQRIEVERATAEEVRRLNLLFGAIFTMRARIESYSHPDFRLFYSRLGPVDEVVKLIRAVPLLDLVDWRVAFTINQAVDCFAILRSDGKFAGTGTPPQTWFDSNDRLRRDVVAYLHAAERQIGKSVCERNGQSVASALKEWSAVLLETPKT